MPIWLAFTPRLFYTGEMELHPIRNARQLRYQPGGRAGTFTILKALGSKRFRRGIAVVFEVRCDCGHVTQRDRQSLIKVPSSCESCAFAGTAPKGATLHPLHKRWQHMIDRCTNPKNGDYKNYGARGIVVSKRWLRGDEDRTGFENFVADMGTCPPGGTIERCNNSEGYSPDNCIWADKATQSRNRRGLRIITYKGETHGAAEWARRVGLPYFTLIARLKRWPVEKALEEPLRT